MKMGNEFPQDLTVDKLWSFALKNSLCFIHYIGHPARIMSLQRGTGRNRKRKDVRGEENLGEIYQKYKNKTIRHPFPLLPKNQPSSSLALCTLSSCLCHLRIQDKAPFGASLVMCGHVMCLFSSTNSDPGLWEATWG